jgi:DNA polymerase
VTPVVSGYDSWRAAARVFLARRVPPDRIHWVDEAAGPLLPLEGTGENIDVQQRAVGAASSRVPRSFLRLAELVALHRSDEKWAILYRVLWRLQEHRTLMLDDADGDVAQVKRMAAAVKKDEHTMRAFVRFTKVDDGRYVAWYAPDHLIVRRAAPFFADRFASLTWSILTPDESVHWDGSVLTFTAGVDSPPQLDEETLAHLWRTYYSAVFNPARANLKATMSGMPLRRWVGLPEARAIPRLLSEASGRVGAMAADERDRSARPFVPPTTSLKALDDASQRCRGCDLYKKATQAVFGEGGRSARVVVVGEQPGDREDVEGHPFVGPAGGVLDRALVEAGIDRRTVYVTNAVKHFSFEERGKRRIHKTPRAAEVRACRPWLEAELQSIRPECVVCLGATAARSLLGPQARVMELRGRVIADTAWAPAVVVTIHPSAVLRVDNREEYFEMLVADLRMAAKALTGKDRKSGPSSRTRKD